MACCLLKTSARLRYSPEIDIEGFGCSGECPSHHCEAELPASQTPLEETTAGPGDKGVVLGEYDSMTQYDRRR